MDQHMTVPNDGQDDMHRDEEVQLVRMQLSSHLTRYEVMKFMIDLSSYLDII